MSLARYKRRTLVDIYMTYPYKKNIPCPINTTPQPFIKHSECTDHKLSLDWKQWNEIVKLYLQKLKLHIEEGNEIDLGTNQGKLSIVKAKANHSLDFKKSAAAGKPVRFAKNNIDNYYFLPSWGKNNKPWLFRNLWVVKFNRFWIRDFYRKCESDFTKIYKIKNLK